MSIDPTTTAAWIVQGEEDAGPQRRCRKCREWLPLDPQLWVTRRHTARYPRAGRPAEGDIPRPRRYVCYLQPCRCCRAEAKSAA